MFHITASSANNKRLRVASTCATLLLAIAFASAAPTNTAMPASAIKTLEPRAFGTGDTGDHVRIVAVDRDSGGADQAIVVVIVDPGYHINANPPSPDYLIPTTLNVTSQTPLRVIYPKPIRFKPKFTEDTLNVYDGTIRIIAEFPQGSLAREDRLFGTLTAQACTEEICLPPADLELPGK